MYSVSLRGKSSSGLFELGTQVGNKIMFGFSNGETSYVKLYRISMENHGCKAISDEISYLNIRLKLSLILAKMESGESEMRGK